MGGEGVCKYDGDRGVVGKGGAVGMGMEAIWITFVHAVGSLE